MTISDKDVAALVERLRGPLPPFGNTTFIDMDAVRRERKECLELILARASEIAALKRERAFLRLYTKKGILLSIAARIENESAALTSGIVQVNDEEVGHGK